MRVKTSAIVVAEVFLSLPLTLVVCFVGRTFRFPQLVLKSEPGFNMLPLFSSFLLLSASNFSRVWFWEIPRGGARYSLEFTLALEDEQSFTSCDRDRQEKQCFCRLSNSSSTFFISHDGKLMSSFISNCFNQFISTRILQRSTSKSSTWPKYFPIVFSVGYVQ